MFWMVLIVLGCTCQKRMLWGDSEPQQRQWWVEASAAANPHLSRLLWHCLGELVTLPESGIDQPAASTHNKPGTDHEPESLIITHTTHYSGMKNLNLTDFRIKPLGSDCFRNVILYSTILQMIPKHTFFFSQDLVKCFKEKSGTCVCWCLNKWNFCFLCVSLCPSLVPCYCAQLHSEESSHITVTEAILIQQTA